MKTDKNINTLDWYDSFILFTYYISPDTHFSEWVRNSTPRSQGRDKSNDRLVDIGPREEVEFVNSLQTGEELD